MEKKKPKKQPPSRRGGFLERARRQGKLWWQKKRPWPCGIAKPCAHRRRKLRDPKRSAWVNDVKMVKSCVLRKRAA